MEDLKRQIGNRIRSLRRRRSLTLEALADDSRIHRHYMGQIERGEANVTVILLDQIAAALGTPLSALLLGIRGHSPRSTIAIVVERR